MAKKIGFGSSQPEEKTKDAAPRVVVAAMGNVGHIYPPQPLTQEEKESLAGELIVSAKIPFVMVKNGPGRAIAWNAQGKYSFPEEADQVIPSSHPFFKDVAKDLVELCHHPDAGELLIFGWRKGARSLTFYGEQGSHAGPGPEETSGFALMPMGALPRSFKGMIYTQDLRDAAFRAQERMSEAGETALESPMIASGSSGLRIMTYNVHGCMGRDGKISPDRIARIIARQDPDIIALQELSSNDEVHQTQIIAQKLRMTFHFFPSFSIKKGQRGNAIICKYPMRLIRDGSLPKLPRTPFLEPRGALWVEVDVHGKKLQVINTHLSLSSQERILQMKALLGPDWLGNPSCQDPVILCGDFNALAESKIFKSVDQTLKNSQFELDDHRPLKTLPSFYPLGLVDHIFVRPGIKTTKIEVPRTELEKMSSDHLPLIIDVELS